MTEHEDHLDDIREDDNNHAMLLAPGVVLLCGRIAKLNRRYVRVHPFDPSKAKNFTTADKLQAASRFNFIIVENDTLDVQRDQITLIEDGP